MKKQRTTTEVEKAVFKYLDILHKENKVGARVLQRKWNFDIDTSIYLIQLWSKNKGSNYEIITL